MIGYAIDRAKVSISDSVDTSAKRSSVSTVAQRHDVNATRFPISAVTDGEVAAVLLFAGPQEAALRAKIT